MGLLFESLVVRDLRVYADGSRRRPPCSRLRCEEEPLKHVLYACGQAVVADAVEVA